MHVGTFLFPFIPSYLVDSYFQIEHGEEKSKFRPIHAGVPRWFILGLILYFIYAYAIPIQGDVEVAVLADDTDFLSRSSETIDASDQLHCSPA